MTDRRKKKVKVLAVASGGGHWVQLRRLAPAFEGADVAYLTVEPSYRPEVGDARFYVVVDATRWNKVKLLRMLAQIGIVVARERPDVVISTGAAPGYFAIRLGKLAGARTMWIDSIANVEQLSLSGQKIMKHADRCLTQWEHLAAEGGPEYAGAVL
ncbi:MAG: UDP-N-acetylglucosamine--LPS N-acetylglucosamine transferase [Planctomycetota bacterium]|nr:MAG: UDP-N-acetylglucosamine--LPS N-acetylglucosamine transferase [Planctomycetota bacterium]